MAVEPEKGALLVSEIFEAIIGSIKFLWIGFLIYVGVKHILTEPKWFQAYRQIRWSLYLWIVPIVVVIISVVIGLLAINESIFGWNWITLVAGLFGKEAEGGNIATVGFEIPGLGIFLCLLLMAQLPSLARFEEEKFREGTRDWKHGFVRSFKFGMIHMLVGVPLAGGLALGIGGLLFTKMYFKGGVDLATQTHFQYNLLLLSVLLFATVMITFGVY